MALMSFLDIVNIVRNRAEFEAQQAREIRRMNRRFTLTLVFYGLIAYGMYQGTMSALNAPDAMEVCQSAGHSFDTCFQGLNR